MLGPSCSRQPWRCDPARRQSVRVVAASRVAHLPCCPAPAPHTQSPSAQSRLWAPPLCPSWRRPSQSTWPSGRWVSEERSGQRPEGWARCHARAQCCLLAAAGSVTRLHGHPSLAARCAAAPPQDRDEGANPGQSFDPELVKEELRPLVFEEVRLQVSAQQRERPSVVVEDGADRCHCRGRLLADADGGAAQAPGPTASHPAARSTRRCARCWPTCGTWLRPSWRPRKARRRRAAATRCGGARVAGWEREVGHGGAV